VGSKADCPVFSTDDASIASLLATIPELSAMHQSISGIVIDEEREKEMAIRSERTRVRLQQSGIANFLLTQRYPTSLAFHVARFIRVSTVVHGFFLIVSDTESTSVAGHLPFDMISQMMYHEGIEMSGIFTLVALQP